MMTFLNPCKGGALCTSETLYFTNNILGTFCSNME
uniref:Uncharacterized protein n=1 Tax=Rhizophora mucronata TaxID=61149 RepID=A0A2P2QM37_RHIMU